MKIKTYKLKGRVYRLPSGTAALEVDENNKVFVHEVNIDHAENSRIPSIAKELADHNDLQRTIAKGSLLKSQHEAEVNLEFQYLTD